MIFSTKTSYLVKLIILESLLKIFVKQSLFKVVNVNYEKIRAKRLKHLYKIELICIKLN